MGIEPGCWLGSPRRALLKSMLQGRRGAEDGGMTVLGAANRTCRRADRALEAERRHCRHVTSASELQHCV